MLFTDPWPHGIYENFLSDSRFDEIKQLGQAELHYLDMFGYYSRSNHYYRFVREDIIPEVSTELISELPECREYKSLRKLVHWSVHPPKFNYPEHIDNDSRIFTAVLYVNPENNLGTILCKNNSSHAEDHGKPKLLSDYEVEVPWKQNTLFTHNSINGKTWHRYSSSTQRITLNVFLVDPNLILTGRIDTKFLI